MDMKCRKVKSNLLLQDCFLRDVRTAHDLNTDAHKKKIYHELQRKTVDNGVVEELVEVDYPITPESVKSYSVSCDYRNDPAGAILRGSKGKNLGDVRDTQRVLNLDSPAAQSLYQHLKEVFEKSAASDPSATDPAATDSDVNLSKE